MKRLSKRASNHRHAKRRAAERYGLNMIQRLHRQIVQQIQAGQATPQGRLTNTRTRFEVEVEGQRPRVIYDRVQKNLVTILPLGT